MSETESSCAALAEAYGWHAEHFHTPGKSPIPGVPDLYLTHAARQLCLFWEAKTPTDRLTAAQLAFLRRTLDAGGLASAGTRDDLKVILDAAVRLPRFSVARRCAEILDVWAAKKIRDIPGSGPGRGHYTRTRRRK